MRRIDSGKIRITFIAERCKKTALTASDINNFCILGRNMWKQNLFRVVISPNVFCSCSTTPSSMMNRVE